jgi:hypothetical protein
MLSETRWEALVIAPLDAAVAKAVQKIPQDCPRHAGSDYRRNRRAFER